MSSLHEALPRTLKPLEYAIHCFDIDQSANKFKANVKIDFKVNDKTDVVKLNQKYLSFTNAKAIFKNGESIDVGQISNDENSESVSFKLQKELAKDELFTLDVDYNGVIRNDMAGFYSSSYFSEEGNKEFILATQFESTDARSAFPCYDEPNAKAKFSIKLSVDSSLQVLSNMPLEKETNNSSIKTFEFVQSPKMSTYLVAWAIGKFEHVETTSIKEYNGSKLPIRVYTVPGQSHTGQYALEVAQKAVDYLSVVFDIDYPLPKLDLLAVPQFGANAMENWGLVTFRSTALLFDPQKSNKLYKQKVTYVVSHEIAHSWFGNYCTMDWWSDLWLNESFATYVGWLCVEHIHKEWDVFTGFVTDSVQTALDLDSLKNSHPVEVQVYHANEIDEIFDHISYLKGGSIVRMVAESVGVDLFLKGVSNYLKKHAFGNAKSDDLWDAISEISNANITQLVAPWIKSVGFPYLKVQSFNNEKIKITQSRFLSSGEAVDDDIIWWIPNVSNMSCKEILLPKEDFKKLNKDTIGFYRVIYDDKLFASVVSNLDEFTVKDKIGLVGDTCAASQAGLIPTGQFLDLLRKLKHEANESVWNEIVKRLNSLRNAFYSDDKLSSELDEFAKELYGSKFQELIQKEGELSFGELKLRSLLFTQAGDVGLPAAIEEAKRLYEGRNIEPIFKAVVFKLLLKNDVDDVLFNEVLSEVLNPTSIDAREVALSALGSISNPKYLPRVLDLLTNGTVPEMDFQFLTSSLSSNGKMKEQFWSYFRDNFDYLHKNVSMWTLSRVLKGFLPNLVSKPLYDDITVFFNSRDNTGYEKGILQSLDSIANDLAWYQRSSKDVKDWFD